MKYAPVIILLLIINFSYCNQTENNNNKETHQNGGEVKSKKLVVDDPGEDFDIDEFHGFDNTITAENLIEAQLNADKAEAKGEKRGPAEGHLPPKESLSFFALFLKMDFTYEIATVAFLTVYGLCFYWGKKQNQKIAKSWLNMYQTLLASQFFAVGHGEERMRQESYSCYTLQASGRINCDGLQAKLNLKKRQDLVSMAADFFLGGYDTVEIDIPMTESMPPVLFAIIKESDKKKFVNENYDVEKFTRKYETDISSPLVVFAESKDVIDSLITQPVLLALQEYANLVDLIYFTDISTEYLHQKMLHFKYKLPADLSRLKKLMEMAIYFIDHVARLSLSKHGLDKAKKNRLEWEKLKFKQTLKEREEIREKEKLEKLRKEKEKLSRMSPEEQAKYEAKNQKRLLKKKLPKAKVVHA